MSTYRILFVCMGNICRSPAGEATLRKLVQNQDLEEHIEIDSAGTIGFHTNSPPDPRMHKAAASRNIHTSGTARQVLLEDLDTFDRVLAMDNANLRDLQNLAQNATHHDKIKAFCDYCENFPDHDEVPDPYYGGQQGFELVLDLLEDGCQQLLQEATQALGK